MQLVVCVCFVRVVDLYGLINLGFVVMKFYLFSQID